MNTNFPEEFKNYLLNVINCKLISVLALVYVYNGEKDIVSPQELLLLFDSEKQVRLRCNSDGESLIWDNLKLEPTDLGEYGEEIIEDISYLPCWKNLVGHTLKDVKLIKSSESCLITGLQLSFENSLSAVVVNLGDEIFMFESLSEKIKQEEGIRYEKIF